MKEIKNTKFISTKDYYALTGLLELARRHGRIMEQCEVTAKELMQYDGYGGTDAGHFSDAIWELSQTIDNVLKSMDIQVKRDKKNSPKKK